MSLLPLDQQMGYDRSNTMFTPDGRILQVDYAKNTVKHGSLTIGMVCKDGVLVVIDKRYNNKLIVNGSTGKIMQVDDHIGCAMCGLLSDGRILVEIAQVKAQQHRITFGTESDVLDITKYICQEKQLYTQLGGLRPYGVGIMIAGVDSKPRLFLTNPLGNFLEYKATVFGEGASEISKMLGKKYKDNITILQGLNICKELIKKHIGKDFDIKRIDGFYIKTDEKKYKRLAQIAG